MRQIMHDDPARMTTEDRLSEIADILATAVVRLKQRKPRKNKRNPLDFSPERSVYDEPDGGEKP